MFKVTTLGRMTLATFDAYSDALEYALNLEQSAIILEQSDNGTWEQIALICGSSVYLP